MGMNFLLEFSMFSHNENNTIKAIFLLKTDHFLLLTYCNCNYLLTTFCYDSQSQKSGYPLFSIFYGTSQNIHYKFVFDEPSIIQSFAKCIPL